MSSLRQLKILVTRPRSQAKGLCSAIVDAGGVALPLHLVTIEGPTDNSNLRATLARARDAESWIFTSPNAVAWALRLAPPTATHPWPVRLAATGCGTARALRACAPRSEILLPETDGAAGLLALPAFQNVAGHRLAIIRGMRPLALLENRLRELGAELITAEVYRRRALHPNSEHVAMLIDQADAAIVTSGESLRLLWNLTPISSRRKLQRLQLVVPSLRVVQIAREMGFRHQPLVPYRVSDDEFVKALLHCHVLSEL